MYNVEIAMALFLLLGTVASIGLSHNKLKKRVEELENK